MQDYQRILFPYAYNILGSSEDAKDAIQDVIIKYSTIGTKPDNEKNYLIRGVINEAINLKKKKSLMQSSENWLPGPVAIELSNQSVELKELASYSVLILLERLNPKERAVFILKEAFAYTHPEIAEVLNITVEGSRKLLSRAHEKVKDTNPKKKLDFSKQFEILDQLVNAIRQKDLKHLHNLLAEDIRFVADGGAKVKVMRKVCTGIKDVAALLIEVHHQFQSESIIKTIILNHQPALLCFDRNILTACQIFDFDQQGAVKHIGTIVDPDKLASLSASLNQ